MDPKRLVGGVAGGLAGGILFGLMMQMMGVLGMVAALVGQEGNVGVGWVVHLGISVLFGLIYALVLGPLSTSWGRAVGLGAVYGAIWWLLGPLLLMPAMMGMPVFQVGAAEAQSLVGHLLYGLVLGVALHGIAQPAREPTAASRA